MGKGIIQYYLTLSGKNPISDFLDTLNPKQQVKLLRILNSIKAYGLQSVFPHLKKLTGTPFWEIRVLGKDNIRVIYISFTKDSILALHGFIKKTEKTPQREIKLAFDRYNDWLSRNS